MPETDREQLQRLVDSLFRAETRVSRLDVVLRAEALDLPEELRGMIDLLPPVAYTRHKLADQINSALKGHGWTGKYGTVD